MSAPGRPQGAIRGQAVRLSDVVLLTGRLIEAASYAVKIAQISRAKAGVDPSADLDHLAQVLAERPRTDLHEDPPADTRYMTTKEVAELIGCTERHARRLAPRLGAEDVGGRLLYPRQAVTEHHEGATTCASAN